MATKRQQTMAKITRERAVKEKRERKLGEEAVAGEGRTQGQTGGLACRPSMSKEKIRRSNRPPPGSAALILESHGDDGPATGGTYGARPVAGTGPASSMRR